MRAVYRQYVIAKRKTHDLLIQYPFPDLQSKYLIDPLPPLITNPEMCIQLSYPALKRNLAAHAEKNSFIVASGTKMEMVERLAGILKTRTLDLAVRDMLEGYDH